MGQGVGPQGPRGLEGRPMESQEVKGQASIVYYDLFHLFLVSGCSLVPLKMSLVPLPCSCSRLLGQGAIPVISFSWFYLEKGFTYGC